MTGSANVVAMLALGVDLCIILDFLNGLLAVWLAND